MSVFGFGIGVVLVVLLLVLLGFAVLVSRFYRQIDQGKAMVVNTMGPEPKVTFTGMVVYPIINKCEVMDISVKTIKIDRRAKQGLICKDNIRADIEVTFFVRVNKTREDVIKVSQAIGCARASDPNTLDELFSAKFSEALKTVGKQLDFVDLYTQRHDFRDRIVEVIGRDLNGYVLEDVAIDYLEQTALKSLDPDNILDAQGIRKITELTTIEHVLTNDFMNTERKQIKKQDVEANETVLELERQQAEAQAKQTREIQTVQAREQAETLRVQAEERLKAEMARIKADEEIQVNEQNMQRQIEVAGKNRERVVGVEGQRSEKDQALEGIAREREVELQRIAKERAIEGEKKAIADIIRQRIAVDKTVAEEEERIKSVRMIEEARRIKDAAILTAEGEAGEQVVKQVKSAEAGEQAARFNAKERLVRAEAELEAAEREARAKVRLAEGIQAEAAARGLAEVRVKEADAQATEKQGFAQARITLEQLQAKAAGEEAVGQARVRVQQAEADAVQKTGLAHAVVRRETGLSEAIAIKEKMLAEAAGLAGKADSMRALDDASRGHEEYRLRLDNERAVQLEAIHAQKDIAGAQAQVLGEALKNARIDIVGGDGMFFDRVAGAISAGRGIDAFVNKSETTQKLLADYLSGEASLPADIKEVMGKAIQAAAGAGSQITLAALLAGLLAKCGDGERPKLQKLLDTAHSLGLDRHQV